MKPFFIRWACLVLLVCIWTAAPQSALSSLLPEGLVIQDDYDPGPGPPIGRFTQVEGEVIVIHKDGKKGYRVASGISLYEDDTIVALVDAHAAFRLEDGSFITLAPETIMVIVKSDYVAEKNIRSTFVNMVSGKARSVVQPLVEARRSEFTVKTKTAVLGVRGSDFFVYATEAVTEITALADTRIEVLGLAALDVEPLILTDFEQTRVFYGMPPETARRVAAEEIDQLLREFRFRPDAPEPDVEAQETPVVEPSEDDADMQESTVAVPPREEDMAVQDPPVVVPQEDLVDPGTERFMPEIVPQPVVSDDTVRRPEVSAEKKALDISRSATHQKVEETVKSLLPNFPERPQE